MSDIPRARRVDQSVEERGALNAAADAALRHFAPGAKLVMFVLEPHDDEELKLGYVSRGLCQHDVITTVRAWLGIHGPVN